MTRSEIAGWIFATFWCTSFAAYGFGFALPEFYPKWAVAYAAVLTLTTWALVFIQRARAEHQEQRSQHTQFNRVTISFFLLLSIFVAVSAVRVINAENGGWNETLADRLAFLALTFSAMLAFLKDAKAVLRPLTYAGTLILGLISILGLRYIFWLENGREFTFSNAPLYGNVNMAAEIAGLCLPAAALLAIHPGENTSQKTVWIRWITRTVLTIGLVYVWFTLSRSALLAGTIALLVFAALETRFRRVGLATLAIAATVIVCVTTFTPPRQYGSEFKDTKVASVHDREEIWRETWRLIQDHPAGVGPGQFPFAYIPYKRGGAFPPSEKVIEQNPHNEYLQVIAEDGWIGALLIAGAIISILIALKRAHTKYPTEIAFVASSLAFVAVQAFFQFPLFNAPTFLATGALLGLGLALTPIAFTRPSSEVNADSPSNPRASFRFALRTFAYAALAATALISSYLGFRATSSNWWLARMFDPAAPQIANAQAPSNWRAGLFRAERLIASGQAEKARTTLRPFLSQQRFHFPVLRFWATASFMLGDDLTGCRALYVYDAIFDGKSSMHDELENLCQPEILHTFVKDGFFEAYQRGEIKLF